MSRLSAMTPLLKQTGMMKPNLKAKMRTLGFHLLAMLVVLSPLVLIEVTCRLFIPPPSLSHDDPYISFSGIRPLFEKNASNTHWETAPNRLAYFDKQSFTVHKDPQGLRIFCLGGSTVQGRPYQSETSFTAWLQLNLQAALPNRVTEVVNCGGISYASYRLVPILQEVLAYEPDLIILYTGHNEFLEDRTYQRLKRLPKPFVYLHQRLRTLRTYAWLDHWMSQHRTPPHKPSILPTEVHATLDRDDGLASYHRDSTWHEGIIHHFQHNLTTMVQLCQQAEVPLLLINPVSNLKDCPPFKSEHTQGLRDQDLKHVRELMSQARKIAWSQADQKVFYLEQAATLDPENAELLYLIGLCYHYRGQIEQAKAWFTKAKDCDICPLRILSSMQTIIQETAAHYDLPYIDMQQLIVTHTEDGIPGQEWLLDHVHPNIEGHQLLANELVTTLTAHGFITPVNDWQSKCPPLWQTHFDHLEPIYFRRARTQLENLKIWSRGIPLEKQPHE